MRLNFTTILKCAIGLLLVVSIAAIILIKHYVFPAYTDDELFLIAEQAFSGLDAEVQHEVDEILSDDRKIESNMNWSAEIWDSWGYPAGIVRGSYLSMLSKKLPYVNGCYYLCYINRKKCIRIRYGWPSCLADLVIFHSREVVTAMSNQRKINQHVLVYRVYRHD